MRDEVVHSNERINGWCPLEKAFALYDSVLALSAQFGCPITCVELGVFYGKSLVPMALALQDAAPNHGIAIGIDPFTQEAIAEGKAGIGAEKIDVAWWHDNVDLEAARIGCIREIAARKLNRFCQLKVGMPEEFVDQVGPIHLLHIDDNHTKIVSMRNATTWLPKVVPGGLIFVDDCNWQQLQYTRQYIAGECEPPDHDVSKDQQHWEVYRRKA